MIYKGIYLKARIKKTCYLFKLFKLFKLKIMPNTSFNTYARAFTATKNIKDAAGNYENTTGTKIAKTLVGILTLGIGYGVMRLIEEFAFVKPKVHEFCDNACRIFNALEDSKNEGKSRISVETVDGNIITLEKTGEGVTITDANGNSSTCKDETFQSIKEKIEKDFVENPGFYSTKFVLAEKAVDISTKNQPVVEQSTYRASQENISSLREKMADFIKDKMATDDRIFVIGYINDAVLSKFESIPENDSFWKDKKGLRSDFDFKIKTKVFHGKNKSACLEYLKKGKDYTGEQIFALVDILFKTDKTHPFLDMANLFCMQNEFDFSKITFFENHFYISGKEKSFIPDDGNCFFHCLDYLNQRKA